MDASQGSSSIGYDSNFEVNQTVPSTPAQPTYPRGGYYGLPVDDEPPMAINSNANMYSNFLENSASTTNLPALPRQAPSPTAQHPQNQVNGGAMAGMNVGMPMNAGHQMDLNHLYEKVQELSDVLKSNREKTKGIIKSAEEVMVSFVPCLTLRLKF